MVRALRAHTPSFPEHFKRRASSIRAHQVTENTAVIFLDPEGRRDCTRLFRPGCRQPPAFCRKFRQTRAFAHLIRGRRSEKLSGEIAVLKRGGL